MRRSVTVDLFSPAALGLILGACVYSADNEPSNEPSEVHAESALTSSDGVASATVSIESDWGSGYRAKVTLTSASSTPTTGWRTVVNLNGSEMTSSDLDSVSPALPSTGPVTIVNKSWNGQVSSSKSVVFGFNGRGSGRPTIASLSYSGASGGAGGATGTGTTAPSTPSGGGTVARGGSGGSTSGGSSSPPSNSSNPFAGATLFVDSSLQACRSSSAAGREICATPQAEWIGNWSGNVTDAVRNSLSRAGSALRVLVAYNIYNRDCGGQSAGGASSPQAYRDWISAFANGIGNSRAVVILEPDALAHNCGASNSSDSTTALVKYAVETLEARPNAHVYVDAGHSRWIGASDMASRLRGAGIASATGFALNVSNFQPTSANISYGKQIAGALGGKPFVIDTSRSALESPDTQWCNPRPRGLGKKSTANTGDSAVHAFFWIKKPGESDGACNGGPAAGQWYEDYAQHLYSNARL